MYRLKRKIKTARHWDRLFGITWDPTCFTTFSIHQDDPEHKHKIRHSSTCPIKGVLQGIALATVCEWSSSCCCRGWKCLFVFADRLPWRVRIVSSWMTCLDPSHPLFSQPGFPVPVKVLLEVGGQAALHSFHTCCRIYRFTYTYKKCASITLSILHTVMYLMHVQIECTST